MRKKQQEYFLFESTISLEQALTIYACVTQGMCPYKDLQAGKGTSTSAANDFKFRIILGPQINDKLMKVFAIFCK